MKITLFYKFTRNEENYKAILKNVHLNNLEECRSRERTTRLILAVVVSTKTSNSNFGIFISLDPFPNYKPSYDRSFCLSWCINLGRASRPPADFQDRKFTFQGRNKMFGIFIDSHPRCSHNTIFPLWSCALRPLSTLDSQIYISDPRVSRAAV